MPRIICKCTYLSANSSSDRGGYAIYISTRDGVEVIPREKRDLPATGKQRDLISRLLSDFPDTKDTFEYEDYVANPNTGNASEFITRVLEDHYSAAQGREGYVSYISERPRTAHVGEHGLFGSKDGPVILSRVANEIRNHKGNIWTPIISIRREDAERLQYDNAESWQALLRSRAETFAKWLKIPQNDFIWYAAYHNEGNHPHVHMLCYSRNPSHGYLTAEGIDNIRSAMARDIFRHDLEEIYQNQTLHRSEVNTTSDNMLRRLSREMMDGVLDNDTITQLMADLVCRLHFHNGKKVYGYLRAPVKSIVDRIVDELEKDPHVAEAYAKWCADRQEVIRSYKDVPQTTVPLSKNKEFKQIRNMVVKEAVHLMQGDFIVTQAYSMGQSWNTKISDTNLPVDDMLTAAESGDQQAQFALGTMYLFGDVQMRDEQVAVFWLTQAASQGNLYADYLLDRRDQWPQGSLILAGTRLLSGIGQIFASMPPAPPRTKPRIALDQKRRRELQQKKGGKGILLKDEIPDQNMVHP